MTKQELASIVSNYGDAIITYRSEKSNKLKYNVCTMDFDNKYIQSKKTRAKAGQHTVLCFCWDTDSYRILVPENVTSIVPLNKVIKNEPL